MNEHPRLRVSGLSTAFFAVDLAPCGFRNFASAKQHNYPRGRRLGALITNIHPHDKTISKPLTCWPDDAATAARPLSCRRRRCVGLTKGWCTNTVICHGAKSGEIARRASVAVHGTRSAGL
jgi:hypothetical protein